MKVERISLYNTQNRQNTSSQKDLKTQKYAAGLTYNPIFYKDFNINFGQRLFRTPENFYAQSFNQEGMPQTMKDYLYDDFEDRQKMPPSQMLNLVFDDIKETKSLEQVKRLFPDEPLFKNINDKPNRNSRVGVIAEIDLMKEEGKTLFKNGQDNLGLYILKKIYTESKTLKEINTDFKKDISVHYKGISPIDYQTLSAYGIKFPNNSFWKSLTATREEFPYEYKPRKAIMPRIVQTPTINHTTLQKPVVEKKKFDNVKDWEIDKLSDAMVKGNGSQSETEKQLKKRNIQNKDALNFVAKYMGEINSIVLEKLHISPDMKDYFENYDDLTKNQQQKFESYMKRSDINELRSKVMTSTIRLFFDVYGADGNNEDFQELLDYAHNTKARRIAQEHEHNRLQEEYERELGIFDEPAKNEPSNQPAALSMNVDEMINKLDKLQKLLDEVIKDYDVDVYRFQTEQGEISIVSNLKEAYKEYLEAKTKFMPKQFANKFINFVLSNPSVTDSYILTTLLQDKGVTLPQDARLMSEQDALDTTFKMYGDFQDNNDHIENKAALQAILDVIIAGCNYQAPPKIFLTSTFEFIELFKKIPEIYKPIIERLDVNKLYTEYKRPLSTAEKSKISIEIMSLLKNYNPNDTIIRTDGGFSELPSIFYSISKLISNDARGKQTMKKVIGEYLDLFGGSARFFINNNIPQNLKMAKLEQFLLALTADNTEWVYFLASLDKEGLQYIKTHSNKAMQDIIKWGFFFNSKPE